MARLVRVYAAARSGQQRLLSRRQELQAQLRVSNCARVSASTMSVYITAVCSAAVSLWRVQAASVHFLQLHQHTMACVALRTHCMGCSQALHHLGTSRCAADKHPAALLTTFDTWHTSC